MRIVFFGTPAFAVPALEALAASSHGVAAVVTRPDRPHGRGLAIAPSAVKQAALGLGLEVHAPARIGADLVATVAGLAPAALVVIAYGKILPAELLALTPGRAVNVHASLLPRHRGASPIQAAILAGDERTGVTTMAMDAGLDTGPMLLAESIPIGPEDTALTLGSRLAGIGATLLLATLARLEAGDLVARPQDPALATYAPRIGAADAVIDWTAPASVLDRRVRAYQPWPGAVTSLPSGRRLKLVRAYPRARAAGSPGTVVAAGRDGIEVACGEGVLVLLAAQPEGKRVLPAADLVNGRVVRVGDRLGG